MDNQKAKIGRSISFAALVVITSLVLVLFYKVVSVFLLPLFLALVAVLILSPLYVRCVRWTGQRRYVAAGLTTFGVMMAILIPVSGVLFFAATEAGEVIDQLRDGRARQKLDELRSKSGLDYPLVDEMRFIQTSLSTLRQDAAEGATAVGNPQALERIGVVLDLVLEQAPPKRSVADNELGVQLREVLRQTAVLSPGTLEYQQHLTRAEALHDRFRSERLGGPWMLKLREFLNPDPEQLQGLASQLFAATPGWFATLGGATGSFLARTGFDLLVFVVALFFWLADGDRIVRTLMTLSPLDDEYERELLKEFQVLVRAVVAGSMASALAQALLGGIAYWLAGVPMVILLMALTGLMSMIPFVGAALVWVPVSLWLIFVDARMAAGIGLGVYGILVISTVDNVVRPWILMERASLHPLGALIGVLGGAQALGAPGVFVGPIVVAFLQSLLMLLHREYSDPQAVAGAPAAPVSTQATSG